MSSRNIFIITLILGFLPNLIFAATINSITPDRGLAGEIVIINGENFGDNKKSVDSGFRYVRVGGFINTKILSWSNSAVKISTPTLQEATSDITRLNPFWLLAKIPDKASLGLLSFATKLFDATVSPVSADIDNTIAITVVTPPFRESNQGFFTYAARPSLMAVAGDFNNLLSITYDSFGEDIVGLLTNPKELVETIGRETVRGIQEVPLFVRDLFTGRDPSQAISKDAQERQGGVEQQEEIQTSDLQGQITNATSGAKATQPEKPPQQLTPPKPSAKKLTVQLADQYMIPVATLGIGYAYGQTPDMYLLDAVGDRLPGQFCSPKGCVELGGFRVGQKEASGIWEFSKDIPYGNYTIVFTDGGCCGNTDILREWGGFKKEISITNDNERFVKASVETKGVKIPVYFNVNLVNQVGTPINSSDGFPCYLIDKSGKKVSINTIGFIACLGGMLKGGHSAPLSPGDYILRIEKDGYQPFEKTISIPNLAAFNDNEILAKIPKIEGNLTLTK